MSSLAFLQQHPVAYYLTIGLIGLVVGSFLNVVIYRLPIMLERDWRRQCRELLGGEGQAEEVRPFNLMVPGSRCPHCGHPISALENIPVLSYLWLRGRCAACGAAISARYPSIELLSAVLAMVVAWRLGVGWQTVTALLLTWSLLALGGIDLDTMLLPDSITLPLLWLGLLANSLEVFATLSDAVIGAVGGYLFLWSVYHLFRLVTGKEGMGQGDFKLLAMLGAWMGWQMLPVIVLLSSLVGALIGTTLVLLRRHDRGQPIPFGPYLAIAGWVGLLWGHDLIRLYLR